jgi:hypothetical protein
MEKSGLISPHGYLQQLRQVTMCKPMLRKFWQKLEANVHPEDIGIFERYPHSFNLEFPPPAFIGDVDNAPVVILMANGGYGPDTAAEFETQTDRSEYISWLRGETAAIPPKLSPYYTQNPVFRGSRGAKL